MGVSAGLLPAWVLLVASVSFMLDHLVMTDGHRGAYDLHARQADSVQTQNRSHDHPKSFCFSALDYKSCGVTAAVVHLNG